MTRASSPQIGDFVTITDGPGALTWEVVGIQKNETAVGHLYALQSGQSGRRRYATEDEITPYTNRRITS